MWGGIKSFCSMRFNVSAWGLGADKKNTHTPLTHTPAKFRGVGGRGGGVWFSVLPNWSLGRVLDWIISPSFSGWLEKSLTFRMWPPPCVFLKPPGPPDIFLYFYLIASMLFGFWVDKKVIHLPSVHASLYTRSVLLSSTSGTSGPDASPQPFLDKNLSCPMIF
jgi:hypothetical protein